MKNSGINILLIEDDADDIDLLEDALQTNNVLYNLQCIKEGDKVGPFLDEKVAPLPDIIILDFNIPKLHGREILTLIKSSDKFNGVPVVVLTTSTSADDMAFAKQQGATHYITKPTSVIEFNNAIAILVKTACV